MLLTVAQYHEQCLTCTRTHRNTCRSSALLGRVKRSPFLMGGVKPEVLGTLRPYHMYMIHMFLTRPHCAIVRHGPGAREHSATMMTTNGCGSRSSGLIAVEHSSICFIERTEGELHNYYPAQGKAHVIMVCTGYAAFASTAFTTCRMHTLLDVSTHATIVAAHV